MDAGDPYTDSPTHCTISLVSCLPFSKGLARLENDVFKPYQREGAGSRMAAGGPVEIQTQLEGAALMGRQWKVVCTHSVWIK